MIDVSQADAKNRHGPGGGFPCVHFHAQGGQTELQHARMSPFLHHLDLWFAPLLCRATLGGGGGRVAVGDGTDCDGFTRHVPVLAEMHMDRSEIPEAFLEIERRVYVELPVGCLLLRSFLEWSTEKAISIA